MAGLQSGFSSARVDFGIIVSDIAKAATFYTAIGFKEVGGFSVPAEMGEKSGLTDKGKPFEVRIFQLGDGEDATNVKIMQFAGTSSQRPDNSYIHSALGVRYLTLYVDDMDAAVERAGRGGGGAVGRGALQVARDVPGGHLADLRARSGRQHHRICGPQEIAARGRLRDHFAAVLRVDRQATAGSRNHRFVAGLCDVAQVFNLWPHP